MFINRILLFFFFFEPSRFFCRTIKYDWIVDKFKNEMFVFNLLVFIVDYTLRDSKSYNIRFTWNHEFRFTHVKETRVFNFERNQTGPFSKIKTFILPNVFSMHISFYERTGDSYGYVAIVFIHWIIYLSVYWCAIRREVQIVKHFN